MKGYAREQEGDWPRLREREVRLGTLRGIEIWAGPSLLLVLGLVVFNLASTLAAHHRDWGAPVVWGTSLLAAALFFLSVLAHELAPALVARAHGCAAGPVRLFALCTAGLDRPARGPRSDLLIAAVGPVTSGVIGLGAGLAGMSLLADGPQRLSWESIAGLSPAATIFLWVASVNGTLTLFNLLPGFPCDGGRGLRALLWRLTRDFGKATRWASLVGRAMGLLLVGFGAALLLHLVPAAGMPALASGGQSGIWIASAGWFLFGSALPTVPLPRPARQPQTARARAWLPHGAPVT